MRFPHLPRPRAVTVVPRFGAALLLMLLAAGCGGDSPDAGTGGGGGAGGGGGGVPAPADHAPADPAVLAALARRPDLAATRVLLVGLDGCDPERVREMVQAGELPNFKRIMDEGAFGPLRSQDPMLSPLLWTSIATGKFPTEHGVLDFTVRARDGGGPREAITSRQRQVEALWDIVGRHGRRVGVVAWLASHPAEHVNGFMVSERNELLAYLFNQGIDPSPDGKTWPENLLPRVNALRREVGDIRFEEIQPFLAITEREFVATFNTQFTRDNRVNNMRLIYLGTENFRNVGLDLLRAEKPALFCTYFESIDATGHFFQCYEPPPTWKPMTAEDLAKVYGIPLEAATRLRKEMDEGNLVNPGEVLGDAGGEFDKGRIGAMMEDLMGADPVRVERWGGALRGMYRHMDRVLGDYIAAMDEHTVLFVVSDHGFKTGRARPPYDSNFTSSRGGASFHRENGVLGILGKGVRRGRIPVWVGGEVASGARLVDIAPTVLALMGFPEGEDMPGRVLKEWFTTDLETGTVPTYETGRAERLVRRQMLSNPDDEERDRTARDMADLASIPYIGSAEEGEWRTNSHLASSFVEQGRLEEAIEAWGEALKGAGKAQQRYRAHFMMANLQYRLKRPEEALRSLQAAEKEVPDRPETRMMMAPVLGDLRRWDEAIDALERILADGAVPRRSELELRLADALRERTASRPGRPEAAEELARAAGLVEGVVRRLAGEAAADPDASGPDGHGLSPAGRNIYGKILLDLGRFDEALREFRGAADADPGYVIPRNNLGVTFMRLALADGAQMDRATDAETRREWFTRMRGKLDEALRWFDEVIRIQPRHHKAHCNRAEIRLRFPPQDLDAAERDLRRAIEIHPGYVRAKELLDHVLALRRARTEMPTAPPAPPDRDR